MCQFVVQNPEELQIRTYYLTCTADFWLKVNFFFKFLTICISCVFIVILVILPAVEQEQWLSTDMNLAQPV